MTDQGNVVPNPPAIVIKITVDMSIVTGIKNLESIIVVALIQTLLEILMKKEDIAQILQIEVRHVVTKMNGNTEITTRKINRSPRQL